MGCGERIKAQVVRLSLPLFAVAMLVGCASPPIREAKVIVPAACPVPKIPAKKPLPVNTLPATASPQEVMRAYVESVQILINDDVQLREILKGYTP